MYVIIGASGNTGRIVAEQLLAQGKKVRVVGRNANHLAALTAEGAEAFTGDVTDNAAMAQAFAGAQAVYVMIPPKEDAPNFRAYQHEVQESLASAIEKNNVKYAVLLSSVGAEQKDKTGPIAGLHDFEERLNRISGLNALYLRAAYFMENTLGQADAITQMGYTVGPVRSELKIPMIAARDIGKAAADALAALDFEGRQVRELQGQRDLSYTEVASILGKAIGKPDLNYSQLTLEQFRGLMIQMGMSENGADSMTEMAEALDAGLIHPLEKRSPQNTTATSYETFVTEEFMPVFQKKRSAA